MKKIIFLLSLLLSMTSCLEHGLEEVESSALCDLSNVEFEYRWTKEVIGSDGNPTGVHELHYKPMTVVRTKDEANHKMDIKITVPMPDNKDFTNEVRQQVSLQNLVGMFTVSAAASVKPQGNAPVLGIVGDFSGKTYTYRVVAASGDYMDWVINITEFDSGIDITEMVWDDGLDKAIISGESGDKHQLKVKLSPEIATNKDLKWKIEDESIATVSENGLLTMLSAGATTLTVSTTDGSNLSLSRRIAVDYVPISSITLKNVLISMDLQKNTSYVIPEPVIAPANAMDKTLEWSIENENVVSIDPLTRTLTAKATGVTKLTIKAADGFNAQATATIIVTEEEAPAPQEVVYIGAAELTEANNVGTTPKPTVDTDMAEEIPYQIESIRKGGYALYGNNPQQLAYYNYLTIRAATNTVRESKITVRLNGADGPVVATVEMPATGSWANFESFTAPLNLEGVDFSRMHKLYLQFSCADNWVCNFHYIKLSVDK